MAALIVRSVAVALVLLCAGCAGVSPNGIGSTAGQHIASEPGMSAFCATHRGRGNCPP